MALTALIVLTGGAVRLTGSGLGCSDWPACTATSVVAPLQYHAWVEFGNRLVNVLITVTVAVAVLAAFRRRPRRRDVLVLAACNIVGILGEVVLGGETVLHKLAPQWMMSHFLLGMALLVAALILPIMSLAFADDSAAASTAAPIRILAFGDSLTAGYGLPEDQSFPVQLQKALDAAGYNVTVTNAGVSGDTTADGRARLDWALADPYDFAIVELGANDALRGLEPDQAFANLDTILNALAAKHIRVLLTGMYAPRNLGQDYAREFDAVYPRLIAAHPEVALYPFFLEGVALHPELFQGDGLHPNAEGVAVIVKSILPAVERLLGPPARASR